jgi:hypothetical protein
MTFVMVGASFLAFMSATMLAVDVGMFMVARTEAQKAADAGALAGAVALVYDNWDDRSPTGPAVRNAIAAATSASNKVINQSASVLPADVTFPAIDRVRVRVERSTARGNPLSTFLGSLVGINTVDIGAVATAQVSPADAMTCVKPFTIPDKWIEKQTPPWDPTDTFDSSADIYKPITQSDYTGYNPLKTPAEGGDLGRLLTLKAGTGNNIAPSFYFAWAMPGNTGANDYRWNIGECNTTVIGYDYLMTAEPGNMVGPTKQGMQDLIDKDPYARWDAANNKVISDKHPSPRVVAIPLFDPVYYDTGKKNGRNADLKLVNYMGFFLEEMQGNDVKGYITPIGGIKKGNGGSPVGAFPKAITLVE